jgi:thioesterase domain-containing protein
MSTSFASPGLVVDDGVLVRLTRALQAQIPMTRFLSIEFAELESDRIVLSAPLEPSLNHRGTAFGPGVFTAISLAPWLLVVQRAWSLRLAVQILLRKSEFALRRPIASAYRAECIWQVPIAVDTLHVDGRLRLSATSRVRIDDGEPAASYTAHFTLLPAEEGSRDGDLALPFPEEWRS